MLYDMNYLQLQLGFEFNLPPLPAVNWSKYIETPYNTLIPNSLLVKCGVGLSLLPTPRPGFSYLQWDFQQLPLFTINLYLKLP
jgi:hypothetical protein